MTRKTFMIFLRIIGLVILLIVMLIKITDYLRQPDQEATLCGYSSLTAISVVDTILEEGEITLGEVTQHYQILGVTV